MIEEIKKENEGPMIDDETARDLQNYRETFPSNAGNTVWMERRIEEMKRLLGDRR